MRISALAIAGWTVSITTTACQCGAEVGQPPDPDSVVEWVSASQIVSEASPWITVVTYSNVEGHPAGAVQDVDGNLESTPCSATL